MTAREEFSLDDIERDATRIGIPTRAEFMARPQHYIEKFWGKKDDTLAQTSNGSTLFRKVIRKETFEFRGFKANTLEEIQRICENEGVDIGSLVMHPDFIPVEGGKFDVTTRFLTKFEESLLIGINRRKRGWR